MISYLTVRCHLCIIRPIFKSFLNQLHKSARDDSHEITTKAPKILFTFYVFFDMQIHFTNLIFMQPKKWYPVNIWPPSSLWSYKLGIIFNSMIGYQDRLSYKETLHETSVGNASTRPKGNGSGHGWGLLPNKIREWNI